MKIYFSKKFLLFTFSISPAIIQPSLYFSILVRNRFFNHLDTVYKHRRNKSVLFTSQYKLKIYIKFVTKISLYSQSLRIGSKMGSYATIFTVDCKPNRIEQIILLILMSWCSAIETVLVLIVLDGRSTNFRYNLHQFLVLQLAGVTKNTFKIFLEIRYKSIRFLNLEIIFL